MAESRSDDRLFGAFALAMFAAGVLLPGAREDGWKSGQGFALGVAAEILAVFVGVFGWRDRTAKVAVLSAAVLLVLAVLAYVFFGVHATAVPPNGKMNFIE